MILNLLLATALASAGPQPPSEAAIDAFIAALPPSSAPALPDEPLDEDRLKSLVEDHPGREREVRALFEGNRRCEEEAKEKSVTDGLRSAARSLGAPKLARLTAFYSGAEYAAFGQLTDRPADRLSLSERQELDRIRSDYPLDEFALAMKQSAERMWSEDGLFGALLRCNQAFEESLADLDDKAF